MRAAMILRGYTLVEVAMVVALLALAVAATTVSMKPSVDRARASNFIKDFAHVDARVRQACRRRKLAGRMTYSHAARRLEVAVDGKAIATLVGPRVTDIELHGWDSVDGGQLQRLYVSPDGETVSYGLRVKLDGDLHTDLLCAGLTGQFIQVKGSDHATLTSALDSQRPDSN